MKVLIINKVHDVIFKKLFIKVHLKIYFEARNISLQVMLIFVFKKISNNPIFR